MGTWRQWRRAGRGRTLALCVLLWLAATGEPTPVVRVVDDDDPAADFQAIQPAINVSSAGDIVSVRCGVYRETISVKDGVSVIGENPDCTILDGDRRGSVVTFVDVLAPTEFSGFTVRNGRSFAGGGMFLDNSAPIITRNVIAGNQAFRTVGGLYGYGGGIAAYNSNPLITNNFIMGNSAERTGGGIDMYFSYPIVKSNTIVGNSANRPGSEFAFGGGVYALFSDPTIDSNIILQNTAEAGGGGIDLINSPFFTIAYNDLFQNLPVDLSGLTSPPGPGNVSADPLLHPIGGLLGCPRMGSPVLDAGSPAATLDLTDFFGRPRTIDGDFDGTGRLDIGFCEGGDVTGLMFTSVSMLAWDPSAAGGVAYNLYRGDLGAFRASCATGCVYTQDPATVAGASRHCALPGAAFTVTDIPPVGDAYYFLVTGGGSAEGVLGFRPDGAVLPNDNPCP